MENFPVFDNGTGIELLGEFSVGKHFTIESWICPSSLDGRFTIFSRRSSVCILGAKYGAGNTWMDVLEKIRADYRASRNGKLSIPAGLNTYFGSDPLVGVRKQLVIEVLVNGQTKVFKYAEDASGQVFSPAPGGQAPGYYQLEVGIAGDGEWKNAISVTGIGDWTCVSKPDVIFPDRWYHIAYVRSDATQYLYLNGEKVKLVKTTNYDVKDSPAPLVIGQNGRNGQYFHGSIAVVRFFSKALSETDVRRCMRSLSTIKDEGLVAFWNSENASHPLRYLGKFETKEIDVTGLRQFLHPRSVAFFHDAVELNCAEVLKVEGSKIPYNPTTPVAWSVSFWLKIMNPNDQWRNVIHWGENDEERSPSIFIQPESRKLELCMDSAATMSTISIPEEKVPVYGVWFHIYMVVEDKTVKSFINGEPITPFSLSEEPKFRPDRPFYVMATWNKYATGDVFLKKLQCYDHALTALELEECSVEPIWSKDVVLDPRSCERVSLGNANDIQMSNHSFTLETWLRIENYEENKFHYKLDYFLFFQDGTYEENGKLGVVIRGCCPYLSFFNNDLGGTILILPRMWYHICFTYDVAKNEMAIFVNGILDVVGNQKNSLKGAGVVRIGGETPNSTLNATVNGRMGYPCLFHTALSATRIRQRFLRQLTEYDFIDSLGSSFDLNPYLSIPLCRPDTWKFGITESSFTVELWVRRDRSLKDDDESILGTDLSMKRKKVDRRKNEVLHFGFRNDGVHLSFMCDATHGEQKILPRIWNHIAFRYDKDLKEQSIFLNGVRKKKEVGRKPFIGKKAILVLGDRRRGKGEGLSGSILGLRKKKRALTESEINEHMQRDMISFETSPFAKGCNIHSFGSPICPRDHPETSGEHTAFVDLKGCIEYSGIVVRWRVFVCTPGDVQFAIFRRVSSKSNEFTILGLAQCHFEQAGSIMVYEPPVSDQMFVNAGDYIGWRNPNGSTGVISYDDNTDGQVMWRGGCFIFETGTKIVFDGSGQRTYSISCEVIHKDKAFDSSSQTSDVRLSLLGKQVKEQSNEVDALMRELKRVEKERTCLENKVEEHVSDATKLRTAYLKEILHTIRTKISSKSVIAGNILEVSICGHLDEVRTEDIDVSLKNNETTGSEEIKAKSYSFLSGNSEYVAKFVLQVAGLYSVFTKLGTKECSTVSIPVVKVQPGCPHSIGSQVIEGFPEECNAGDTIKCKIQVGDQYRNPIRTIEEGDIEVTGDAEDDYEVISEDKEVLITMKMKKAEEHMISICIGGQVVKKFQVLVHAGEVSPSCCRCEIQSGAFSGGIYGDIVDGTIERKIPIVVKLFDKYGNPTTPKKKNIPKVLVDVYNVTFEVDDEETNPLKRDIIELKEVKECCQKVEGSIIVENPGKYYVQVIVNEIPLLNGSREILVCGIENWKREDFPKWMKDMYRYPEKTSLNVIADSLEFQFSGKDLLQIKENKVSWNETLRDLFHLPTGSAPLERHFLITSITRLVEKTTEGALTWEYTEGGTIGESDRPILPSQNFTELHGGSHSVYVGRMKINGEYVDAAVKCYCGAKGKEVFKWEKHWMSQAPKGTVPRIMGSLSPKRGCYYLPLERGVCTLRDVEDHEISINTTNMARQIALRLKNFHSAGIVHGDFKMENILIMNETGSIARLFDLDSCCKVGEVNQNANRTNSTMAPELHRDDSIKAHQSQDMFSFGIVLFEMEATKSLQDACGVRDDDEWRLLMREENCPPCILGTIEKTVYSWSDRYYADVTESLLQWEPKKRLTALEAWRELDHKNISKIRRVFRDELRKLKMPEDENGKDIVRMLKDLGLQAARSQRYEEDVKDQLDALETKIIELELGGSEEEQKKMFHNHFLLTEQILCNQEEQSQKLEGFIHGIDEQYFTVIHRMAEMGDKLAIHAERIAKDLSKRLEERQGRNREDILKEMTGLVSRIENRLDEKLITHLKNVEEKCDCGIERVLAPLEKERLVEFLQEAEPHMKVMEHLKSAMKENSLVLKTISDGVNQQNETLKSLTELCALNEGSISEEIIQKLEDSVCFAVGPVRKEISRKLETLSKQMPTESRLKKLHAEMQQSVLESQERKLEERIEKLSEEVKKNAQVARDDIREVHNELASGQTNVGDMIKMMNETITKRITDVLEHCDGTTSLEVAMEINELRNFIEGKEISASAERDELQECVLKLQESVSFLRARSNREDVVIEVNVLEPGLERDGLSAVKVGEMGDGRRGSVLHITEGQIIAKGRKMTISVYIDPNSDLIFHQVKKAYFSIVERVGGRSDFQKADLELPRAEEAENVNMIWRREIGVDVGCGQFVGFLPIGLDGDGPRIDQLHEPCRNGEYVSCLMHIELELKRRASDTIERIECRKYIQFVVHNAKERHKRVRGDDSSRKDWNGKILRESYHFPVWLEVLKKALSSGFGVLGIFLLLL